MSRIEPIEAGRVRDVSPVERVTRRPDDGEPRERKEQKQQARNARPVSDDGNGQAHVDVVV